jgi:hypothetical protein
MSTEGGPATTVRVRPRAGLLGTAILTAVLVTSPLFGVLYWFTIPLGRWIEVLAIHFIVLLACLIIGVRQLAVFAEVRDGRLRGNGIFSPLEEVDLHRIARVDLVDTYVGLAPNPVRQLLIRDADGHRLFRMRGNFWYRRDLDEIAAALPVEPVIVREPLDLRDFFRDYPGSAYWFEDKPMVMGGAIVLGVLAVAGVAAGAMLLAGEPYGI